MAEKITSFPTIKETLTTTETTATGFASRFQGDIYTSRGRFGNGTNYVDISATQMKSSNYVAGTSGWRIEYDGDVEFNDGTFRGDVSVGSLHIPDQDTTAASFHTDTTGNSWWGCTETDFNSDNDNAKAYILNTGVAKFQNVTVETSTSAQRFALSADDDTLRFYDSSGNQVIGIGSEVSYWMYINTYTDLSAIYAFNDSGLVLTTSLIQAHVQNASSTGRTANFHNAGSGYGIFINQTGTGAHMCLAGDPTVASPIAGDFWFDTPALNIRIGATTHKIATCQANEAITGAWTLSGGGTIDGVGSGNFVDKSASETITGTWAFSTNFPTTPSSAPTTNYQIANKKYVDDNAETKFIGVGDATANKTYFHFTLGFYEGLNATSELWDFTGYNTILHSGRGVTLTRDISDCYAITNRGLDDLVTFGGGKDVIVEFMLSAATENARDQGWGLSTGTAVRLDYQDSSEDAACFTVYGTSNLYAHTANSTVGYTNTAITGITLGDNNLYRIEVDDGNSVKFYVNGALKATHTTNLPDGNASIAFMFGGEGAAYTNKISQIHCAIER